MSKPIKIELDEWWYKGCFIQKQVHPQLTKYLIFADTEGQEIIDTAWTFAKAKKIASDNEVKDYKLGVEAFGFKKPTTKKLKQYRVHTMYRGMQPSYVVCAYTQKEASELLDVSMSYLKNYCYITDEPTIKECIENPHKVYASIDSGEFMYVRKDLIRVNLPREELHALIDTHRKLYPTYHDMLNTLRLE